MNVLIVDDDRICNLIMTKVLETQNSIKEILTALNGHHAQEILEQKLNNGEALPDIIFLDLNMPVMDGFEFMAWMRTKVELTTATRVIIASSSDHPRDVERAKALGVNGFIQKPVTDEKVKPYLSKNNGMGVGLAAS